MEEGGDIFLVELAALLHDIGRLYGSPHPEKGIEPARKILESLNYPANRIERILWIIGNHNTWCVLKRGFKVLMKLKSLLF